MFDLATETVLMLAFAAFAAGFVDSIAGGGGLIVVPALLLAGFSPAETLGTNKLQGIFGNLSATIAYAANGHIDPRKYFLPAAFSAVGAALGALLATVLPSSFMGLVLPFVLIGIALYLALKPNLNDIDRKERLTPFLFGITVVPLIGFYDGLIGPGAGSFFMLTFMALAGYGILKATAHTKLMNLASNFGGFLAFAAVGVVHWEVGIMMGLAQFAGARIGAGLAMKKGAALIKPLLVLTCIALAIRLLLDPAQPLRAMAGF